MEVSSKPQAPDALPPRTKPQYPLKRRLSVPQSQSGHLGKEKTLLSLLHHPANDLVTIQAALSQLLHYLEQSEMYPLPHTSSVTKVTNVPVK